ncbi:MAG: ribonuclease HI [Francisellaceae bacterium]|jgi:ribonuclease HI|nr:ribonuclease HI [Francisellaceae bacterium]MBT6207166.1 ribonuclease HI [Francisellaceae bacterium]MBT6539036.1 ribonuclease HI [Francisellaceae bacterium]
MVDLIEIYTDGSCLGNPGAGGWAALLKCRDTEKMLSGGQATTTNNQMELLAALKGLRAINKPSDVKVITDSKYLKNGMTEWIEGWKKKNWRTAAGKPVKNKELWVDLDSIVEFHNSVEWEWVKAHAGHEDNERVDDQARSEAEKFI